MKLSCFALGAAAWLAATAATAGEPLTLQVCHEYGCKVKDEVVFDDAVFNTVKQMLDTADDPVSERHAVAAVVARLYVEAGKQTPIGNDHGGDAADQGSGSVDCIDHAHNTATFLHLLEVRRMLRFHSVGGMVKRGLFFEHWAAELTERASGAAYAVDSWYYEPGTPAVVMPLPAWRAGQRPPGIMAGFR